MIVKFKITGNKWGLIDNVREISKEEITYIEFKKLLKVKAIQEYTYYGDKVTDDFYVILASLRFDNKHRWVVFSGSVYLCNDEGKTIEKIK